VHPLVNKRLDSDKMHGTTVGGGGIFSVLSLSNIEPVM